MEVFGHGNNVSPDVIILECVKSFVILHISKNIFCNIWIFSRNPPSLRKISEMGNKEI